MTANIYTLGINDGHLATAALLKNGEIISCISEERFTNIKNQSGIPVKAISFCLDSAGISPHDINLVVFGGVALPPTLPNGSKKKNIYSLIYSLGKHFLNSLRKLSISMPVLREVEDKLYNYLFYLTSFYVKRQRINNLQKNFNFITENILFLDHHLCHAYTAIFSSNFSKLKNKKVAVITCDGEGDKLSATVNIYKDGKLKTISRTSMTNSLGNLYRSVTQYLGMKPLEHEYKVMGLAAYVSSEDKHAQEVFNEIKNLARVDSSTLQIKTAVNSQVFKLGYLEKSFKGRRFDYISYAVQKLTENVLVDLVEKTLQKTGTDTLALSGGVFMNVKANQKISEIKALKKIFIMPSCGDESNAIGAAYWGYAKLTQKIPSPLTHLYLGNSFTGSEILKQIKADKIRDWKVTQPKNIEVKIAQLLASGEIVARFSGRSEWGARALGNRSILADASNLKVVETINKMIKSRDFWMPFAAVIMRPYQDKYIVNKKDIDAPFMIVTFDTTDKGKLDLAAAMHQYDKTVRPQLLDAQTNPEYYKILQELSNLTGRHGALNTSFNLHGSPIVGTPKDALFTFKNSGLKYLVLGNFLIEKTK